MSHNRSISDTCPARSRSACRSLHQCLIIPVQISRCTKPCLVAISDTHRVCTADAMPDLLVRTTKTFTFRTSQDGEGADFAEFDYTVLSDGSITVVEAEDYERDVNGDWIAK